MRQGRGSTRRAAAPQLGSVRTRVPPATGRPTRVVTVAGDADGTPVLTRCAGSVPAAAKSPMAARQWAVVLRLEQVAGDRDVGLDQVARQLGLGLGELRHDGELGRRGGLDAVVGELDDRLAVRVEVVVARLAGRLGPAPDGASRSNRSRVLVCVAMSFFLVSRFNRRACMKWAPSSPSATTSPRWACSARTASRSTRRRGCGTSWSSGTS